MNPQAQQPSREQVTEHLTNMLTQKTFALGLYEKQRKAKDIRYRIALHDFKIADIESGEYERSQWAFEASTYEYECDTANLDYLIVQTKLEIENIERMKKDAESSIVDPRKMGVVM